ncbi:hypothetical protein D9M71_425530 [compost metagenome]
MPTYSPESRMLTSDTSTGVSPLKPGMVSAPVNIAALSAISRIRPSERRPPSTSAEKASTRISIRLGTTE